ncbi:MAG: hypothetical protein AB7N91_16910 [Candidatus Tectimicrobiota bacterium]
MLFLQKILENLGSMLSNAGLWLLVWIAALVGFSLVILRMLGTPKQPRPWVVRKGECPFCGNELFGTTRDYQRLHLLETLSPDSKYLCTHCDRDKISDLLSKYRLGLADD